VRFTAVAHLRIRVYEALIASLCWGALVALVGCEFAPPRKVGSVLIRGSETMRPLASLCADVFMARHPAAAVIVLGGGTATGIAALLHGTIDISMASRNLSVKEREYATRKALQIEEFAVALDGVAIVAHPDNPLSQLDLEQLRRVFTGKVRNWHELGGGNHAIDVLARSAGSGTSALFLERALVGEGYVDSVQQMPTNTAIVEEIARRPSAIGYSGLEAVQAARGRVKTLALRTTPQSTPVSPTVQAVRSGNYPLARTLFFYTLGDPLGLVKSFIDFCLSEQSQILIRKAGFVNLEP
jgi:phosphate transport system substrate-binding protein